MSNSIIGESDIPSSFTSSPDRPFEMVGVRDQYLKLYDVPNKRLTDDEIKALAKEPHFKPDTSRIDKLTKEANEKEAQEFHERKLYNLSMQEIGFRISDSWHDIIDDLLHFNTADGVRGFVEIFLQHDRLIYLGITLMLFTIAPLFIRSV